MGLHVARLHVFAAAHAACDRSDRPCPDSDTSRLAMTMCRRSFSCLSLSPTIVSVGDLMWCAPVVPFLFALHCCAGLGAARGTTHPQPELPHERRHLLEPSCLVFRT